MASRSLGALTLDLVAKTGGFEQGMDKAGRILDQKQREFNAKAKSIGTTIGAGIAVGLAAAGGLAAGVKMAIDRMDELSKSAQKVSLPTEQFSQLAYAGELADVSVQDLESSLGKLIKSQAAANNATSTQAKVFDALGISVKNADGTLRNSLDVFYDFADRFKDLDGAPEATAAGLAIFGKSFQNIIPLLKDGSQGLREAADESDRLGNTLSGEAGRNAEEFNDNLTRLKTAVRGLFQGLASDLLPTLVDLSNQVVDYVKNGDNAKSITDSLSKSIRDLAQAFVAAVELGGGFLSFLDSVKSAMLTIESLGKRFLPSSELFEFSKKLTGLIPGLNKVLDRPLIGGADFSNVTNGRADFSNVKGSVSSSSDAALQRRLNAALAGSSGKAKRTGSSGKSDAQREAEALQKSYESLIKNQEESIALFGKTTEAAKVTYETQFGDLKGLSDAQKQIAIQNAERLDSLKTEAELNKAAADAVAEKSEQYARAQEDIKGLISDMQFELKTIGETNAEREKEIALRYAGSDATEEQRKQISDLSDAINMAREQKEFLDDFKSSVSDLFVDFVSGAKSAKDAFGDFADQIYKRALQFVADKAIQALFASFSGGQGGGFSGFLSSLYQGNSFGGGKAVGGSVSAGMFYRINENGPEMLSTGGKDYLMMGSNSGTITPNGRMGGGVVNNNKFVIQASRDSRTQEQIAASVARETSLAARRNG